MKRKTTQAKTTRKPKPVSGERELLAQLRLMSQFIWMVRRLMAEQCITKGELARLMKKPTTWVRRLLDGEFEDVDARTMSDVMTALNRRLVVQLRDERPTP
jgi:hypothetical protein